MTRDRQPRRGSRSPWSFHNHQPVGNFGWVFEDVYRARLPAVRRPAPASPVDPLRPPLHRPAAAVARPWSIPLPRRRARARDRATRSSSSAAAVRADPRVAPGARPDRPADADGRRARATVRAGGRAARGSPSASGSRRCPRGLVDSGLRMDDRRRRPPARRGDPRRGALGHLHDRRPGSPAHRLRHGAGPALPHPVPARSTEVIEHLRTHATPDGIAPRHDGRRRREVRGMAHDVGALLGRGQWMETFFDGARGERRLADDRPTVRLGRTRIRPLGRVYLPTSSYTEMTEWALPPDDAIAVQRAAGNGAGRRTGPRRSSCAAASGATSSAATARSTTSTSRCSERPPRWMRCRPAPTRGARPGPPLPGPVERLLLARPVRRDLPQPTCASRRIARPDRRRGPRRRPSPATSAGRDRSGRLADVDIDGVDEVAVRSRRARSSSSSPTQARPSADGMSARRATR